MGISSEYVDNIDFTTKNNPSKVPKVKILQSILSIFRYILDKKLGITIMNKFIDNMKSKNYTNNKFRNIGSNTRSLLVRYYKPFNDELSILTDKDVSIWNK